jgi:hypothetical protein
VRRTITFAAATALLLCGCGSDESGTKPPPKPKTRDTREWQDHAPGDPRREIKALKKAREEIKQAQETRKLPE